MPQALACSAKEDPGACFGGISLKMRRSRKTSSIAGKAADLGHTSYPETAKHGLPIVSLFSLLTPAKDYLLAGTVKLWFNQNLKRYGQMTQIRIDSQNHRIDVELLLRGESSPIQLALKHYELSSESGETFIAIGGIETSREWINQLISEYLPPDQKRFKVPGALKVLL
jgi:hypothetical protein